METVTLLVLVMTSVGGFPCVSLYKLIVGTEGTA
jgi:hypothetical protein